MVFVVRNGSVGNQDVSMLAADIELANLLGSVVD
jgi:hypothetical protein